MEASLSRCCTCCRTRHQSFFCCECCNHGSVLSFSLKSFFWKLRCGLELNLCCAPYLRYISRVFVRVHMCARVHVSASVYLCWLCGTFSDKDGYVTFLDFLRSYNDTIRHDRWKNNNRKVYGPSRAAQPKLDPTILGRWQLTQSLFLRPTHTGLQMID